MSEEKIYEVKKEVTIQVAMGWKLFYQLPGALAGSWSLITPESYVHRFTAHEGVLFKSGGGGQEESMLESLASTGALVVLEPVSSESEQAIKQVEDELSKGELAESEQTEG